ncbi:hypothetical protein BSZ37_06010 [Rubrivirga marina]|uniref:Phage baseplate protein n=1 Tax=Rubrivirga marina TaxID=1196024 RepID=A0A271J572_9BACT|nr:hypothetical protein BSZ37_06010 [Rubrivirga marina]
MPAASRALLLLGAAHPDEPPGALAALPVGRRDARLLRLRERTLGPALEIETRCPACDERLELTVPGADLRAASPAAAPEPLRLDHNGTTVTFRLPTSRDLLDATDADGLLRRCVLEAHDSNGEPVADLGHEVRAALAQAMAEADPLAEVDLAMTCVACGHEWSDVLDVASFVWAEFEAWAPRLLRDVHRLASAYGWAERDVLAMSAWRRGQYLQLLDA